jgi:hypothetical protein
VMQEPSTTCYLATYCSGLTFYKGKLGLCVAATPRRAVPGPQMEAGKQPLVVV